MTYEFTQLLWADSVVWKQY